MDRLLTQPEADALIAIEKHRDSDEAFGFPPPGGKIVLPLVSHDGRERFLLDVARGRINLQKCTYQNRARSAVILVRLDIEGPPHQNPDGEVIPCPHIHLYREGYGDKWARPLPPVFAHPDDLFVTLFDFFTFCNVTKQPLIQAQVS